MTPYVNNILPALLDNPIAGPTSIEWLNLKSALQTFVIATFNINVFRPQFQKSDIVFRCCQVPQALANISMLELLVKLCINIDFTKSEDHDQVLAVLHNAVASLPEDHLTRLRRRLCN